MKKLISLVLISFLFSCGNEENKKNSQESRNNASFEREAEKDCEQFKLFMKKSDVSKIDGTYFVGSTSQGSIQSNLYISFKDNQVSLLNLCKINNKTLCSNITTTISNEELDSIIYFHSQPENELELSHNGHDYTCDISINEEMLDYSINSNGEVSFLNTNNSQQVKLKKITNLK